MAESNGLKPVYLIYGDAYEVDQAVRRLKSRIAAEVSGNRIDTTAEAAGKESGDKTAAVAGVADDNSNAEAAGDRSDTDAPAAADTSRAAEAAEAANDDAPANNALSEFYAKSAVGEADARLDARVFEVPRKPGKAPKDTGIALEAVRASETLPFFAVTNLVVVKGVDRLSADEQHILADYAANPSPATLMVLTAEKTNKASVLYKTVSKTGQVHEYEAPKGAELVNWVARKIQEYGAKPDRAAVSLLIEYVGTDQAALDQEARKLAAYAGDQITVDVKAVEAVAARNPETNIFAMVDALGMRDANRALGELNKLLKDGEPPQRVMAMVVRQFRLLIRARAALDEKLDPSRTAKLIGGPPFVVEKIKTQARRFTADELVDIFTLLKDKDIAMKTGGMEPALALEMLVAKLTTT
jgi:DNA polymerase-3 subunit delta